METLIIVLGIFTYCAVILLHLYTCFTEARHLNRWPNRQVILLLLLTGTLFLYFVSPSARNKLLIQIGLLILLFVGIPSLGVWR